MIETIGIGFIGMVVILLILAAICIPIGYCAVGKIYSNEPDQWFGFGLIVLFGIAIICTLFYLLGFWIIEILDIRL